MRMSDNLTRHRIEPVALSDESTVVAEFSADDVHTTGSGKTLTSFKAAQLACGLADIDKVLFVRKPPHRSSRSQSA